MTIENAKEWMKDLRKYCEGYEMEIFTGKAPDKYAGWGNLITVFIGNDIGEVSVTHCEKTGYFMVGVRKYGDREEKTLTASKEFAVEEIKKGLAELATV